MPRFTTIKDDVVFKLIKEVKKRDCLFNANASYDRYLLMKNWHEVANEIGKPEQIVRQRWRSLRDMFSKECKRYGPPGQYTGRWRFFEHLGFIYKTPRNTTDDEDSERGEPEYLDEEAVAVSTIVKAENENGLEEFATEDPLIKKRRLTDFVEVPTNCLRPYSGDSEHQKEDFDLLFLKSLTPYFKQLEPMRKLVVRNKIQDMLFNELSAQMTNKKS